MRLCQPLLLLGLPLLIAATLLPVAASRAEVPLLKPAELLAGARHIVTGEVRQVFTAEKSSDKKYVDTLFAVEVAVGKVLKGEGIAADQLIYVKAWQMKKRPRGWAGPSGQDTIPEPGQRVTLYLTGEKGSYDALSPNGIRVDEKKTK